MPPQQLQKIADNWKNNKGKIISAYQKYELYQYKIANPDTCFREMSELFSEKFQAGSNFIKNSRTSFQTCEKYTQVWSVGQFSCWKISRLEFRGLPRRTFYATETRIFNDFDHFLPIFLIRKDNFAAKYCPTDQSQV